MPRAHVGDLRRVALKGPGPALAWAGSSWAPVHPPEHPACHSVQTLCAITPAWLRPLHLQTLTRPCLADPACALASTGFCPWASPSAHILIVTRGVGLGCPLRPGISAALQDPPTQPGGIKPQPGSGSPGPARPSPRTPTSLQLQLGSRTWNKGSVTNPASDHESDGGVGGAQTPYLLHWQTSVPGPPAGRRMDLMLLAADLSPHTVRTLLLWLGRS